MYVFFLLANLLSSSLVLILQKPSAFLFRANILCRIFILKIGSCHSICIFSIHISHAYVTVGLITILNDLSYMLSDNYLLVNIPLFFSMLYVQQRFFPLVLLVFRSELSYLAPLGSENISTPYFKQCFFQGEGVLPPRQSNTTPPSPKTEITNILFYILNFASIIKFKM